MSQSQHKRQDSKDPLAHGPGTPRRRSSRRHDGEPDQTDSPPDSGGGGGWRSTTKKNLTTYGKRRLQQSFNFFASAAADDEEEEKYRRRPEGDRARKEVTWRVAQVESAAHRDSVRRAPDSPEIRVRFDAPQDSDLFLDDATVNRALRQSAQPIARHWRRERSSAHLDELPPALPPRPTSRQGDRGAMGEPSAADVAMVCEISNVGPDVAKRWLQVKNGNVEAALNAIMEGESLSDAEKRSTTSQFEWDEGHFHGDRDNGTNLAPLGASAAPTRGPSPAPSLHINAPKNRNDEDSELAAAIAASRAQAGLPLQSPTEQETGVLMHDGVEVPSFGPANKDDSKYANRNNWALVTTKAPEQDAVPDVESPADRTHVPGEPRLLKHLPNGDYASNLLTILHAIPAAREALLLRDYVRPDYGGDREWWSGKTISLPQVVNIADGSLAEAAVTEYDELLAETQRLMAFLHASKRSYASVGGLLGTGAISNVDMNNARRMAELRSGTLTELFMVKWTEAALAKVSPSTAGEDAPITDQESLSRAEAISRLFTTTVGTNAAEGMDTPHLTLIDMTVAAPAPASQTQPQQKQDLHSLLDALLWDTDVDEISPDAINDADLTENYLEQPASVLVMRLHSTTSGADQLGVEVPAVLNVEKYLRENVAATRGVRMEMARAKAKGRKLESLENRLRTFVAPATDAANGAPRQYDAKVLLQHSHAHFTGQLRREADRLDTSNAPPCYDPKNMPAHYPEVAAQLEAVMRSVEEKLALLQEEKEKLRQQVIELSRSCDAQWAAAQKDPKARYTLRGVATKPNITYVLRRKDEGTPLVASEAGPVHTPAIELAEGALIRDAARSSAASHPVVHIPATAIDDEDHDDDDNTPADHQWWRIDYEAPSAHLALQTSPKITVSKAPDYDVLRAVELEHSSALLVYASDDAVSAISPPDLPTPLQELIDRDDAYFAEESSWKSSHRERVSPPDYGQIDRWQNTGSYDLDPELDVPDLSGDPSLPADYLSAYKRPRRPSTDSTRAQYDRDDDDNTDRRVRPAASFSQAMDVDYGDRDFSARAADGPVTAGTEQPELHHAYGLGYDVRSGSRQDDEDGPVAEINLTPERTPPGEAEKERDVDMRGG